MVWHSLKSLKIRNIKCFLPENEHQGFDDLKPINVLIGKNNSGKSKLLEFIKKTVELNSNTNRLKLDGDSIVEYLIAPVEDENWFRPMFLGSNSGAVFADHFEGNRRNFDCWEKTGKLFLGEVIKITQGQCSINKDMGNMSDNARSTYQTFQGDLINYIRGPLQDYKYLAIQAERDIRPEEINAPTGFKSPLSDGEGLSKLMAECLVSDKARTLKYDSYAENEFLGKLNSVLSPDILFDRINAKLLDGSNNRYEIILHEKNKGGISLSDCGSGIKTALFVLVLLHLVPKIQKNNKFVYAFEELENNLHPALERKLLAHIRDHIKSHPETLLFLTTHSNVAIDMFGNDDDAQIVSVRNDGKASYVETVDTWDKKNHLLDDLGVKASDLLQANCIVWLEGPSDRIYFDKWMELFSNGRIQRGVHYECALYGGSNIAHHSLDDTQNLDEFIKLFRVNRKAIILMDSDIKKVGEKIKPHVSRIKDECTSSGHVIPWVTFGREVENYIPDVVLKGMLSKSTFDKFTSIADAYKDEKDKGVFVKVDFARKVIAQNDYNLENLSQHQDLAAQMAKVIDMIDKLNKV